MKRIPELTGQELKWVQPHATKMEYELLARDEPMATLRFRSSFGSLATAETAGACWTFKRVGFFRTSISVRPCGSEADIATFKNHTWQGGGTLEFADGRKLLANTNFWATEYEFKTEAGESLVKFRQIGGFLHLSSVVDIAPSSAFANEIPLLVTLGWYLTILMHMDAAVAAAA